MNKKYTIVNANLNDTEFCIDYFFYIVIFILAIYLVIQYLSIKYNDNFSNSEENFESTSAAEAAAEAAAKAKPPTPPQETLPNLKYKSNPQKLTVEQELQEALSQKNALKIYKETLEEKMKKQSRALYLSNNYYRIDNSSLNDEISFINDYFVDIRLPKSDFKGKELIKTRQEWNNLLAEAKDYKNIYKVGDVVLQKAGSDIVKDRICYGEQSQLNNDPLFKKKYPECMVCSIAPEAELLNTKTWKDTKTNISSV